MTSEGLGEMFESDFGDICAEKCMLMLMGANTGSKDPLDMSEINLFT
jgi:hypothetical protein